MKGPGSNLGSKVGAAQSTAHAVGRDIFTVLGKWETRMPTVLTLLRLALEFLQLLGLIFSPHWNHSHLVIRETAYFVRFFHFGWWWDVKYAEIPMLGLLIACGIITAALLTSWMFFFAFARGIASQTVQSLNYPPMIVLRSLTTWMLIPTIHMMMAGWYCSGGGGGVTHFPVEQCWGPTHIAVVAISVVGLIGIFLSAIIIGSLLGDESPLSTHILARSHHVTDVVTILMKFALVIAYQVFVPHGYMLTYAVISLLLFLPSLAALTTLLPFYHLSTARWYCAMYSVLSFVACVNIAVYSTESWFVRRGLHSQIIAAGIPVAAWLGSLLPYFRISVKFLLFAGIAKNRGIVPLHEAEMPFSKGLVAGERRLLPKRYVNIEDDIVSQMRQEEARLALDAQERIESSEILVPFIRNVKFSSDVELSTRGLVHLQQQGTHLVPSANMLGFATRTYLKALVHFRGSSTVTFHFASFLFYFTRRATLALELLADILTEKDGDVTAIVLYPAFKFSSQLKTLFGIKDITYEHALSKLRSAHKTTLTDMVHFWGKLIDSEESDLVGLAALSSQIARRRIETNEGYVAQIGADETPNRHLLIMYTLFLEHIMLDVPSSVKLKHVADELSENRKRALMSSQSEGAASVSGGAESSSSLQNTRSADIVEILSHAGGRETDLDSGSSSTNTSASQLNLYSRSMWCSLLLLIVVSFIIAAITLYNSSYSDWLAESLYHEGVAHTKVQHLGALSSLCSSYAQACPKLFDTSIGVHTAEAASDSGCYLSFYQACLRNLSTAEVLMRESHNLVTFGQFGLDQEASLPSSDYRRSYLEPAISLKPASAFQFNFSEPESRGPRMGTMSNWIVLPAWEAVHRVSLGATELTNALLRAPDQRWAKFLVSTADETAAFFTSVRGLHQASFTTTVSMLKVLATVTFILGALFLFGALYSLEGVLQTVGSTKVVVLKLFELIPLPVQRSLYVAAKGTLESFEALSTQKEGGSLGDVDNDRLGELDGDEDEDAAADEAGPGGAEDPSEVSNNAPLPEPLLLGSSSLFLSARQKRDSMFEEDRKMSTFLFGATTPEARSRSDGEGVEHNRLQSILKAPSQHKKKKTRVNKVAFTLPIGSKDTEAEASGRKKLAEPTLKLTSKTSQLVNSFLKDMKSAAEEEETERRNAAAVRAAEIEKLMQLSSASDGPATSTDAEIDWLTQLRNASIFVAGVLLLLSLASVAGSLAFQVQQGSQKLSSLEAQSTRNALSFLYWQEAAASRYVEATHFVAFGEVRHYHAFFQSLTLDSTGFDEISVSAGSEATARLNTIVESDQFVSRAFSVAIAMAFRGHGVDPALVPLASTLDWEPIAPTEKLAAELGLATFLEGTPYLVYVGRSAFLETELALANVIAASEGAASVSNLSAQGHGKVVVAMKQELLRHSASTCFGEPMRVMKRRLRGAITASAEALANEVDADLLTASDFAVTVHDFVFAMQIGFITAMLLIVAFKVFEIRSETKMRMATVFPLDADRISNPANFFVILAFMTLLALSIATAVLSRQLIAEVQNHQSSLVAEQEHLHRFEYASQIVADAIENAGRFAMTGNERSLLALGSATPALISLYDTCQQLASYGGLIFPSKSELVTAYEDLFRFHSVAILLRSSTQNMSAAFSPPLTTYNLQQEVAYEADNFKFGLNAQPLQYTDFAADLRRSVADRIQMAKYASFSARTYTYHQALQAKLVTFRNAIAAGVVRQRLERVDVFDTLNLQILGLSLALAVITILVLLQPLWTALYGRIDKVASSLIENLHGGMRMKNSISVTAILALLVVQFAICIVTLSFPGSVSKVLAVAQHRSVQALHTSVVAERLFDAAGYSRGLETSIYQRQLKTAVDDLDNLRSELLSIGKGAPFGQLDPNTAEQNRLTFEVSNSANNQLQKRIDAMNLLVALDFSVVLPPVTPGWVWLPMMATTEFSASSKAQFLSTRDFLTSTLADFDTALAASSRQYLRDAHAASIVMLRIPAIVLVILMVAVICVATFVVFLPMMRTLVLEERGTTSLLGMIPSTVRPFVPKISQYLETGSLVKAEADLAAFPKASCIETFCQQWVSGVDDDICFGVLDTMEHAAALIDSKGTFIYANQKFYDLGGFTADGIIGANVRILMNEPLRGMHDSFLERYITQGTSRLVGTGRDVPLLCADGSLLHCFLNLVEATRDTGEVYFLSDLQRYDEQKAKTVEASM